MPARANEMVYDCCPEPYLDITFTIRIRWAGILACDWSIAGILTCDWPIAGNTEL